MPNAKEGRDSTEWKIEGMSGIPEDFDYETAGFREQGLKGEGFEL